MLRRPRHATGGGPARWILIAVLGAACLGGLIYLLVRPQPASLASQRRVAAAYRTGPVQQLINEGGSIVEDEIKPSLPDLAYAKLTPEQFRTYASGWHAGLDRARLRFDACPAPSRMGRAKSLYDQALEVVGYGPGGDRSFTQSRDVRLLRMIDESRFVTSKQAVDRRPITELD